ncbi:DUF2252 domain-containing protein [Spirosoma endbachense]|uniref:DUF2252 domain-containing protein n=2 Tax=Spirosoma endbachense TaxID=2666025 RepID=A0A6P1W719_9BACT|nr:DUF2252 domain-containing protein [Spirosoma endbachense]
MKMKKFTQNSLVNRIRQADSSRQPEHLPLKYKAMRESAFRFFRATPYLFYQDWMVDTMFKGHPHSWVCGDFHLENLGSYRADNGQVYFDINDFDESILAPCTVDVARLLTSLFVAAPDLNLSPLSSQMLARKFLEAYCQTLIRGKPRSLERETAQGVLKQFLNRAADQTQSELIDEHTKGRGQDRRLKSKKGAIITFSDMERDRLLAWLNPILSQRDGARPLDIAFRIAGTNSLGLNRYVALIQTAAGKRKLLDIKAARPSVALPYFADQQPNWPNEATRIVTLQQRLQDVSPGGLSSQEGPEQEFFVMRVLQPQADRLKILTKSMRKGDRLLKLLNRVAQLLASAHLRSGGQQGSAITDDLIAFAKNPLWVSEVIEKSEAYSHQVQQDYLNFCSLKDNELITS